MVIDKRSIIDIIRTAPLHPGEFITNADPVKTCIVGALAKQFNPGATKKEIYDFCMKLTGGVAACKRPLDLAKQGNLFGALSALFENVATDNDDVVDASVRQELVTFVDRYFPAAITIGE